MTASSTTKGHTYAHEDPPTHIREWLAAHHHTKLLVLLDRFETELRLGRLFQEPSPSLSLSSSSSTSLDASTSRSSSTTTDRRVVAVRTVDLVRQLIGSTKWKTPAQLLALLRSLGNELQFAGGFQEPVIGNVVRRIMAAIREEAVNTTTMVDPASNQLTEVSSTTAASGGRKAESGQRSLESMLWALPQHVKPITTRPRSASHQRSESMGADFVDAMLSESTALPPIFYQPRADLKQAIMEAIQEIMSDLEDLHKNISDQATNHIHAGEIILTYGKSQTVEKV